VAGTGAGVEAAGAGVEAAGPGGEAAGADVEAADTDGAATGPEVGEQPESSPRLMPAAATIAVRPRPVPFMSRLSQNLPLKWPSWSVGPA